MQQVQEGQCGLCTHFGEHHMGDQQLVQIRKSHSAPENLVDECGHPRHALAPPQGHPDRRLRRVRAGADDVGRSQSRLAVLRRES